MERANERYFAIGDIHGEVEQLNRLMNKIESVAGFKWGIDHLVQLGDKNDRGKNTYGVMEYFMQFKMLYPDHVHLILGNHERMLINAANGTSDLMYYNGGNHTLTSYVKATGIYGGKHRLKDMLVKSWHWDFLAEHLLFLETEDYFFCHAPIPLPQFRQRYDNSSPEKDFRLNEHLLTWAYEDGPEDEWVDPNPVPNKLCVYGHIHGMYYDPRSGEVKTPGPRTIGRAKLIDTGCGCAEDGYLTALELPAMKYWDSKL